MMGKKTLLSFFMFLRMKLILLAKNNNNLVCSWPTQNQTYPRRQKKKAWKPLPKSEFPLRLHKVLLH